MKKFWLYRRIYYVFSRFRTLIQNPNFFNDDTIRKMK